MKPQEFLKENEFIGDDAHQMHQSHQHHMLREECYHSAANAIKLHQLLGQLPEGHELDAWAAEKISLANDYLKTVTEWLEYDVMGGTNEAMMPGGMEAFSMESAERQYAELLGEEQGVAGGIDPQRAKAGKIINRCFGKISEYEDDGWEYLDRNAPVWYNLFGDDQYGGDIDAIIANAPIDLLVQSAKELTKVVSDLPYELDEAGYASRHPQTGGISGGRDEWAQMAGGKKQGDTLAGRRKPGHEVAHARALGHEGGDEKEQQAKLKAALKAKLGVAEGEITKTAAGTKHRSTSTYGGTKDTNHLRTLDKATTNRIDRALDVKYNREKKFSPGLDLSETTSAGGVATAPAVGGGTLFGGNYQNPANPFRKKSAKKESIIKR